VTGVSAFECSADVVTRVPSRNLSGTPVVVFQAREVGVFSPGLADSVHGFSAAGRYLSPDIRADIEVQAGDEAMRSAISHPRG